MPSASNDIRDAIASRGGSIPFSEFMSIALYGADGFYSTGGRAGRRGDFITSAEVGPLFGEVLARAIDDVWVRLGSPTGFTICEVGAGPGTLARSIIGANPQCLVEGRYVAVEVSAEQRLSHPDGVISTDTMPEAIAHGVIIANELLDNLPFDLWVFDDGWRIAHVISSGDGFAEILKVGDAPTFLPSRAVHGTRVPIQNSASQWLQDALSIIEHGTLFVIDYCTALTAEVVAMPWREWLRTYAGHERGSHYLMRPGEQDITTQVLVDQLAAVREPDAVRTQAQFLSRWGIDDMVEEGRRVWNETSAAPTLKSIKMRSRVSEAEALLDPHGLGAFTVLEWTNI